MKSASATKKTSTPWGLSHQETEVAPGITVHSTAMHGGICVSAARIAELPKKTQDVLLHMGMNYDGSGDRWFEEDLDACIPAVAFAEEFMRWRQSKNMPSPEDQVQRDKTILLDHYPRAAQDLTGVKATPQNSHVLAIQEAIAKHGQEWIMVDWKKQPKMGNEKEDLWNVNLAQAGSYLSGKHHIERRQIKMSTEEFTATLERANSTRLHYAFVDPEAYPETLQEAAGNDQKDRPQGDQTNAQEAGALPNSA